MPYLYFCCSLFKQLEFKIKGKDRIDKERKLTR